MEVLASIIIPEGRMKKFALSIISLFLFYFIISPITKFSLDIFNEFIN